MTSRTCRALWAAALLFVLGACDSAGTALPDINALTCPHPATPPAAPSSLPALAGVAAEERIPLHGTLLQSGHGDPGPVLVHEQGATEAALARQVLTAARIACQYRTTAAAARAGYVQSSVLDQGVGTHWTNWHLIDEPFDPARPAMLLFGQRFGRSQLVGFSYWVRDAGPTGPAGFAGTSDRWHRHFGLCFDRTGLLQRENVRSPVLCNGYYLNGTDMWMLHAWIVPGAANVWGLFAELNPQLCSRTAPDIARCPGIQ